MSVAELQKTIRGLSADDRRALALVAARMKSRKQASRRRMRLKRHPVSGLSYNAAPSPKVTQADIDAALAEFPGNTSWM